MRRVDYRGPAVVYAVRAAEMLPAICDVAEHAFLDEPEIPLLRAEDGGSVFYAPTHWDGERLTPEQRDRRRLREERRRGLRAA